MEKQNDRKRKILIVICSVVLILLVLFILFAIFHGNKKSNTSTTEEGKKLKGLYISDNSFVAADHFDLMANQTLSKCLDSPNICLDRLEVVKYLDHGLIIYQLNNQSGSWLTGNVRITLIAEREEGDDQTLTFIIPYRNLGPTSQTMYYGFDGWNDFPADSISNYDFEPGLYTDSEALYENLNETEISQITID